MQAAHLLRGRRCRSIQQGAVEVQGLRVQTTAPGTLAYPAPQREDALAMRALTGLGPQELDALVLDRSEYVFQLRAVYAGLPQWPDVYRLKAFHVLDEVRHHGARRGA